MKNAFLNIDRGEQTCYPRVNLLGILTALWSSVAMSDCPGKFLPTLGVVDEDRKCQLCGEPGNFIDKHIKPPVEITEWLKSLPPLTPEQREANRRENEEYERRVKEAGGPLELLHKEMEEQYNKSMGVEGWSYRDIPWTLESFWDELINVIDPVNIKIITLAGRESEQGIYRRGSLLVSPEGMERIRKYAEEKKEAYQATKS